MSSHETHGSGSPPTIGISVVSPVYGCEACLEDLTDRVEQALRPFGKSFELIFVEDRGPDDSWQRICELASTRPWLKGLRMSRNFGQHYAIAAGIEKSSGDVVVVMDCDLQDVPEEIPKLLSVLEVNPEVSVVFGQRIDRFDTPGKRLFSWAFFQLLSWLTGARHDHSSANFGAFRRKVITTINSMPERVRCFPLMVKWTGFPSTYVPVRHDRRAAGQSGYDFLKTFGLAVDIVLSYSDKPLRLVVGMGITFGLAAFAMVILSVIWYLNGNIQVAGFTSLIASIWLVGGVTISCLGVVGLYVGKLFSDMKGRPYYIIDETVGCAAGERE